MGNTKKKWKEKVALSKDRTGPSNGSNGRVDEGGVSSVVARTKLASLPIWWKYLTVFLY